MKQNPLDVWLKMYEEDELGEAEWEANTYKIDGFFAVEYYHNSVGLVYSKKFASYQEATDWLESEGFQDFTT